MLNAYRLAVLGHVAMVAVAVVGGAGLFSASAQAATTRGYYEARLSTGETGARTQVLSGVAWSCAGQACTAPKAGSRPEVVCARLARKVGPLASFAVMGEALDAVALARCNGG